MNKLAIRTASIFAAMTAVIILAFAGAMSASAQSAPERPTDLTAAATHHDTVSLTWSHPDPATVDHYQVFSRQVDTGTGLTQVGTSTTTSFEHDGLEPESTYFYRVKPVNSGGEEGQRSARAEATTPATRHLRQRQTQRRPRPRGATTMGRETSPAQATTCWSAT